VRTAPLSARRACRLRGWLTAARCCATPGIEDLREKREEVNRSIAKDEEEKGAQPRRRCTSGAAPAAVGARSLPRLTHTHTHARAPPHALAAKIQNDLRILTERLARINDNLARKITSRNEYDKTIQETEAAYSKVRACGARAGRSRCRPPQPLPPAAAARRRLSRGRCGSLFACVLRSWRARKRCCTC
jgi:hypothetical protein